MKAGLFQTQRQQLALTNQLRQAIELLQYSSIDLSQFIIEQATDNPLIEVEQPRNDMNFAKSSTYALSVEDVSLEDLSLRAYLEQQLLEAKIPEEQKEVIEHLIMSVDEKGYLTEKLEDIASARDWQLTKLNESLAILQAFDPVGVGARNLQECLLLQLQRQKNDNKLAIIMVEHYLEDVARKNWEKIAKACETSIAQVTEAFKRIQALNPNPASRFGERTNYIIPDFHVKTSNKEISVVLNDHLIPKIKINQEYDDLKAHPEAVEYVKVQLQHYRWLARSISQRKNTLQQVMTEIVQKQQSFFIDGPSFMTPITMKEIAEKIEMHESTVSRAVKNKYVETSHGVYPLRSFFTSKVKTVTGSTSSSFVVKKKLGKIIANENKQKPLSDQKIVEILHKEGFKVSRRAIAKYRNQLGILSSTMRKER